MSRPARVGFLYEDAELIAVDKPAGLPTIAAEGSRGRSLYDLVTEHIRRRNPKGRAALVHRLDRDTSGVMVFAKNAAAKTRLMGAWNELVAQRRYIALVDGVPPQSEGVMDSWLYESGPGRMKESRVQVRGALRALTRYRVLQSGPAHSLVELNLETGRKHQIRVQLAGLGCPVSGDRRYGSRTDPLGRLGLHASLIELSTAPGAPALRFESPVPDGFFQAVRERPPLPKKAAGYRPHHPGLKPGKPDFHQSAGPRPGRPDSHPPAGPKPGKTNSKHSAGPRPGRPDSHPPAGPKPGGRKRAR